MSREDEIKQGLREPSGALIGGLHVEDYCRGICDFEAGLPPPKVTSTSYDLGRMRAAEKSEHANAIMDEIERRQEQAHLTIREMLKDRPDLLTEYDAKMDKLKERK